jgi:hypothetical protein
VRDDTHTPKRAHLWSWRRRPDLNRGWRFCRPYRVVFPSAWLRLLVPDDAWFFLVFGRYCSEVAPKSLLHLVSYLFRCDDVMGRNDDHAEVTRLLACNADSSVPGTQRRRCDQQRTRPSRQAPNLIDARNPRNYCPGQLWDTTGSDVAEPDRGKWVTSVQQHGTSVWPKEDRT